MKKLTTITAALILAGTALSASADSGFYKCVNAALHGPEAKQVRALDHEFDCKPVKKISIAEGTTHYSGHLSHHLTLRPNDEVYYEFKVIDGVLKEESIKTTIDGGGAGWVVGYALTAVAGYVGVPIPPKIGTSAWDTIAREVSGRDWNHVASGLIAAISVQSAAIEAKRLRQKPVLKRSVQPKFARLVRLK